MSELEQRKRSHLAICASEDVEHHGRTLLDDVHLLHEALPELSIGEIDLTTDLLGRRLEAPILISGMSGGTEEAGRLNRALAAAAQKFGLGMGVGSQRAMLLDPSTADTFRVREIAPDILLLANLGPYGADAGPKKVVALVRAIGADALCIHLKAAQELCRTRATATSAAAQRPSRSLLPSSRFRSSSRRPAADSARARSPACANRGCAGSTSRALGAPAGPASRRCAARRASARSDSSCGSGEFPRRRRSPTRRARASA